MLFRFKHYICNLITRNTLIVSTQPYQPYVNSKEESLRRKTEDSKYCRSYSTILLAEVSWV